ncbi:Cyclophilin type peptidyl-prolyl cis-trans isomerase/CLD, putative [Angomonas deanei]|uniref:Cyclophilin type peptidyl-prolyl cis-trans isomerase/CLD, putative n=1 Tax=Angomonas deanei TaxID=59799 RepID=A0A7G2CJA0_9TRYP|nr:Cyclophilin type peptidyl-prolyl cis-trans isomerase/CLD, putative [Angomonas deanei]
MKAKKAQKPKSLSVEVPVQKFLVSVQKNGEIDGTFLLDLFPGNSPKFCELFAQNCSHAGSEKGKGKQPVYKNCPFRRISAVGLQVAEGQVGKNTVVDSDQEIDRFHALGTLSFCKGAQGFDSAAFFICLTSDANELAHLDKNYIVFGKIAENMDYLLSLKKELVAYTTTDGVISAECPFSVAEISHLGESQP